MTHPGRDDCLRLVVESLGATRAGRDLGLHRLASLEDLRASFPIRSRETHEREVEARIGFGLVDTHDPASAQWSGAERERDHILGVWTAYLEQTPPQRVALLRGQSPDGLTDRVMREDLSALGGRLLHIDDLADRDSAVARLEAFDPDVLVVPSALTCRFLENVHHVPLERRLKRLRIILAEHDLREPVRTRVPIHTAGWIHRSGRLGLATMRSPGHGVVLAVGTQIIELLPYTNPEEDGRRAYASATVLPEHAVVGQRYQLVVTSPLGFVRLRTDVHVRVVGFDAPSMVAPFARPRVVRLAPATADVRLEGCTVAGAWLTASVRQALWREDPALVMAEVGADPLSVPSGGAMGRSGSMRLPDAFKDTELGWLARTAAHKVGRKRPRSLLVRIEVQGYVSPDLPRRLAQRVDANLQLRSAAYAYLRERDELQRPRVMVVRAGTRAAEEQRRITGLVGGVRMPDVRIFDG